MIVIVMTYAFVYVSKHKVFHGTQVRPATESQHIHVRWTDWEMGRQQRTVKNKENKNTCLSNSIFKAKHEISLDNMLVNILSFIKRNMFLELGICFNKQLTKQIYKISLQYVIFLGNFPKLSICHHTFITYQYAQNQDGQVSFK